MRLKKLLVAVVGLLLLAAVIGGVIWYRKATKVTRVSAGDLTDLLTDKDGNRFRMLSSGDVFGRYIEVNGVKYPDGTANELWLVDDVAHIKNAMGQAYKWSGAWQKIN